MGGKKKSMVIEKGSNKVLQQNNNEKRLGLESELFSFWHFSHTIKLTHQTRKSIWRNYDRNTTSDTGFWES